MSKLYLRADPALLCKSELFTETSKEELRVFSAVMASGEECSEQELAALAKCPLSRCKAALTLFSAEGIIEISNTPFEENVIEYEHGEISHFSDLEEQPPKEVAAAINRLDLSALLDECANLLDKAALSSSEAARIVSLVTSLSLESEYIIALVSHMKSKKQGTVTRIVKKAEELVGRGIDTYEALEGYISDCDSPGYIMEYKKVFGIYRALSESETECYKKWAEDFGYSAKIIALAYDKSVIAGSAASLAYIDTVLTAWHNAGCKTVAECKENSKAFKDAREAERKEHATAKKSKAKTDAPTPRYGNFDIDEAFKLALSRSYGDEDNN